MKRWIIAALILSMLLCMAACNQTSETPETTEEITTKAPTTTEEITTEAPTTEAPTTEEPTTEAPTTEQETDAPVAQGPTREQVMAAAVTFIDADAMIEASTPENQDYSDFGGLVKNEDGSVTALIQEDKNPIWDPYFYVIKKDTPVDNVMVIQYRSAMEYDLKLYLGTEGNAATGAGDYLGDVLYETGDEWGYVVINIGVLAGAYDASAASLGYLRLGLGFIESGESIDIGYIAFFHTEEDVEALFSGN